MTRKDVEDAALVGEIVAEADLAGTDAICAYDDDDCCSHMLVEHCVAEAIEASEAAVWLWVTLSNAISTPRNERAKDIAATGVPVQRRQLKRLYAWVDLVGGPIVELDVAELHAAALLRDGVLPPAWKIIPPHTRRWSLSRSQAARRRAYYQRRVELVQLRTDSWLTKAEVAEMLMASTTTAKNWQHEGLLTPVKVKRDLPNGGEREIWMYDPRQVAEIWSPLERARRRSARPADPQSSRPLE